MNLFKSDLTRERIKANFFIQVGGSIMAKNALQKELEESLQIYQHSTSETIEEITDKIRMTVDTLNRKHTRCGDLQVSELEGRMTVTDGHYLYISMPNLKGTFKQISFTKITGHLTIVNS